MDRVRMVVLMMTTLSVVIGILVFQVMYYGLVTSIVPIPFLSFLVLVQVVSVISLWIFILCGIR